MQTQNFERLFSADELRQLSGMSRSGIYNFLRQPETPVVRIGRRKLLPGWFIKKLLETGKAAV